MKKRETKLNSKKAQITVFIIIALIIVAVAIATIYFTKIRSQDTITDEYFLQESIKPKLDNMQSAILNCLDQTSLDALTVIGIQGGYYNEPSKSFDLGWAFMPYYYNQGTFAKPTTSEIETELGDYINDNLKFCLEEIDQTDFTLTQKTSKTEASIKPGEVEFEINSPITIEKESHTLQFQTKKHPTTKQSLLYEILEVADYITESHRDDPEMICISCVADMAEERELYVDMLDFDDETTTLIVISENKTQEEAYVFEFLNKYSV
ncbi:hypothetical protein HOE04_00465 [archaeon]|jgi:hypothetical protein|nr:hypothetical protein [archaeon]